MLGRGRKKEEGRMGERGMEGGWCVACGGFMMRENTMYSLFLASFPFSSFLFPSFPLSLLLLSTSAPSQISGRTSEAPARKCSS